MMAELPPLYHRHVGLVTPLVAPDMSPSVALAVRTAPTWNCINGIVASSVVVAQSEGSWSRSLSLPLGYVGDLDGDLMVASLPICAASRRHVAGGHDHLVGVVRSCRCPVRSRSRLESGEVPSLTAAMLNLSIPSLSSIMKSSERQRCRRHLVSPSADLVEPVANDQMMGVAPSGSSAVNVATGTITVLNVNSRTMARTRPARRPRCYRDHHHPVFVQRAVRGAHRHLVHVVSVRVRWHLVVRLQIEGEDPGVR